MTAEQQRALQAAADFDGNKPSLQSPGKKAAKATNEDVFANNDEQVLPVEPTGDEVTNNDGSLIETLDAAFHNKSGFTADDSNRADQYETRSQGKSDAEEEQDFLSKQHTD